MRFLLPVGISLAAITCGAALGATQANAGATAAYDWRPVKIIDGGDMPSIVTHPSVQGLMYIRANIGGAYRWDSPSQIWTPITDWISGPDASLSGVESIAVDPADSNRVYLVAGMYLNWSPINAAILVSTDRGASFQRINLPFMMGGNDQGQQTGERLEVNPFNPSQLYLATHLNGLWQSADHGATWSQVTTFPVSAPPPGDLVGLSFVRFDPRHSGTVYVGAFTGGLYRTTDGGSTWQSIPGQPVALPGGEAARPMRSALDSNGVLYVSYANKSQLELISNGAVFKFDTDAGTWTNITPVDPDGLSGYGFCGIGVDSQHAGTVMVATWNRAWFPGDTIFRSKDSGATWTSVADCSVRDGSLSPFVYAGGSVTPFGNWISSVEIDPFDSNHALYTNGATVWATSDLTNADSRSTVHWTIGADGIEETAVLTLASPPSGAHLLSGVGDACGYRHDDFNVSQQPFLNPWMQTVWSLDFAASNPSLVVRVGLLDYNNNAAGAYSLDQGTTWTRFAANAPGVAGNPGMIAVSADGNTLVWAPIAAAWMPPAPPPACSRDRGETWMPSTGAPANLWTVSDRVNSNKFYGFHGPTGTVYVSTDAGATFAAGATGLPSDAGNNITWQARPQAVPGREGDLWLPLEAGLYHSSDSGTSFTRTGSIDSALLVGFGQAAPGRTYPAIYAVGTIGGVYGIFRSDDQAATWTRINDERHQFGLISVITGDPRIYGRVYLGTSGRGIICGDVAIAPAIAGQPLSQAARTGQTVTFTVTADGVPSPSFQWQYSVDGGAHWSNLGSDGTYAGATTATLTVTNVTMAMNGSQYRCVATNRADSVPSSAATLTVSLGDQAFLQLLFIDVLVRPADPGALAGYGAALAGGRTQAAVLGDLLGSAEYSRRQIEPAIRLYYAALAGPPDYTGLQNWSNALHAGTLTLTGAADQFASGTEFTLKYGSLDNARFVQQLYRNVLGREADPAGLADWEGRLDDGASRGTVLVGFSESDEFKGSIADQVEIERLYFLLLRRMPTATELDNGIGFLRGYDQTETLLSQASPPIPSDADYVQAVFRGFLRRDADAGALSVFAAGLAAGTVTHGGMVETVLNSAEFNRFVAPVSRLYLAALRRVPDVQGLDNWVNFMRTGNSLQVMAGAFSSSQEFTSRYGTMNNSEYVAQLYRDVLGREGDPAGMADWTGQLDSGGATRGQVLIGFSESQEAVHVFAPMVRTFLHYFAFLEATPTRQQLDTWQNYLATLDDQLRARLLADPVFTGGR